MRHRPLHARPHDDRVRGDRCRARVGQARQDAAVATFALAGVSLERRRRQWRPRAAWTAHLVAVIALVLVHWLTQLLERLAHLELPKPRERRQDRVDVDVAVDRDEHQMKTLVRSREIDSDESRGAALSMTMSAFVGVVVLGDRLLLEPLPAQHARGPAR